MITPLLYALEKRLRKWNRSGVEIEGLDSLTVFHLSTGDHLEILLERVLTLRPELSVRVVSFLGADELRRLCPNLDHLMKKHRVFLVDAGALALGRGNSSVSRSVLLYSSRVSPRPELRRTVRRAFLRGPGATEHLIIDGDGRVWAGSLRARLERKILRAAIGRLEPVRLRAEWRLMDRRLLPEPLGGPSGVAPGRGRSRLILRRPVRIMQDEETGTVFKPELIRQAQDRNLYEGDYHFTAFQDARADWRALLGRWRARRERNMAKVGVDLNRHSPGARALDIGCGAGMLAGLLADKGWDTLGIDFSRSSIAQARESFPRARFEVRDLEQPGMSGEKYELLTLSHVIEHTRDDAAFLSGLRGLMDTASILYIEAPWMSPDLMRARRPVWHRQMDHCREYTKLGLRRLVETCGYEVLAHADSATEDPEEPFQFMATRVAAASQPV